ncbi:DEAD/DEAH box helicase family protein [Paenibacillus taichungensis]|uniref:DEAD/DEAH box helicase n=1 Tax=Paenibacillus taichungensis TaxID=484184 RepID=UPI002DB95292|nr:DEAD/DEAH box helicase family protein [Paenibacillus taichungensis]MEC0105352.1 DEAD/DEAH box helicase family protein [Paenibacillus taichungensis]MEC0200427.1 DEAD/DEAH box helicase family protein [Paenibacillus taichungensis]
MYFMDTSYFIEGNSKLRQPQLEAYLKIQAHFSNDTNEEALVVLPTGTGKSGLIAIAPFGICRGRVLIITPGHVTKKSIAKTIETLDENFWINSNVLFSIEDNPILISFENDVLDSELHSADIIYTNVQKINSANGLLSRVNPNHFDMIIVDEAHHAAAESWKRAIEYFPDAKVLHVTGTPYRGDGVIVPGKRIHETKLSEVMEKRYVKWLRNKTVQSENINFYLPDGTVLSLDEAKQLRDNTWVQKSVAMSDSCSLEIIRRSIEELTTLKGLSPQVPHKIMASACSIKHAQRVEELYREEGLKAVLIHSKQSPEEQDRKFKEIEQHKVDVVVNVDMMGEGYDHKYLTIAALFRPYKSLNRFAQVIGRVLRAIPDEEITKYEIDNNALVIYHEELGLEELWSYFKQELEDIGKYRKVREIEPTDYDFEHRETIYGEVRLDGNTSEAIDSFSHVINFQFEFEKAKNSIDEEKEIKRKQLQEIGLDHEIIEETLANMTRKNIRAKTDEFSHLYNEKRPLERRKMIRKLLTEKVQLTAIVALENNGIEAKDNQLYEKMVRFLPSYVKPNTKNDGVLVIFMNTKIKKRFAGRDIMEIEDLINAQTYLEDELKEEVERILYGIA